MTPLPLFGSGIASYSAIVTAQRRLNCYYDLRPDGDKNSLILRGTPGTLLWKTLATNVVRGWKVVNDILYVVAGAVLYRINIAGIVSFLGNVTPGISNIGIDDNGVQLIIVDGTAGFTYTFGTGAFAKITDSNFPNGATTVAFLNGRFQVNMAGSRQYYVSQSYDGTAWTPVIFATKENNSDPLLAVQILNGTLILWGSQSIEFWQDIGGSSIPYQRINGATQTWGLAAVWSRAKVNNTILFLGQSELGGGAQVFMLNGYTPVRISTSDIENIINGFIETGVGISDAVALVYMVDGHPMYQLTFPAGNRSFLYDNLAHQWSEVQTGLELTGRHFSNLSVVFGGLNYVSDYANGNIYELSSQMFTDNGSFIKRQFISRHIRNNGTPFSIDDVYLDMETGVGLQAGQGSEPKIMLQVSKDGGRTFGQERWKKLGRVGQYYSPRVIWNRMGQAVDFVFQLTMTDPVQFIITQANASSKDLEP